MMQEEVLEKMLEEDCDALDILNEADPKLASKFRRLDRSITSLLTEVRLHFPDATYYTASGGFHLMLGRSHDERENPQQSLVACSGDSQICDGDF